MSDINEILTKIQAGEFLTREENLAFQIFNREKEVADYDFNIELLEVERTLVNTNPEAADEHKKKINNAIAANKTQRAIAANTLAALKIMQAAQ